MIGSVENLYGMTCDMSANFCVYIFYEPREHFCWTVVQEIVNTSHCVAKTCENGKTNCMFTNILVTR